MKSKIFTYTIAFGLIFTLISCTVEPKKINYGDDHCSFCDMTVVDKTHAAEIITKKGKATIFDSVECLVNDLKKEKNEANLAFILVSDFANPGNLIDVNSATYLISDKIKSPMGANLSAFKSKETAHQFQKENGGKLFTWSQLKKELSK